MNAGNQIDDTDLCIIVGNALDNAIEASAKIEKGRAREIKLKMMQVSDHLTIEMTNPTSELLKRVDGKIASRKEEPILHGFGLQAIEELVNKYNGNLDVAQDNGRFTLKVYMQNQVNVQ
jgi:sensor histidine kinase regulating citrate/malate metabolism